LASLNNTLPGTAIKSSAYGNELSIIDFGT